MSKAYREYCEIAEVPYSERDEILFSTGYSFGRIDGDRVMARLVYEAYFEGAEDLQNPVAAWDQSEIKKKLEEAIKPRS